MKAHDAAIIMIMANGLKLTPSICDIDNATGNMNAAAAALLMRLVITIVPTNTTANAILGLLPPMDAQSCAILADRPLPVMADSKPKAAPSTAMVFHCTLRQASSLVRQPVASIANIANRAAFNMVTIPDAAATTIATVITD